MAVVLQGFTARHQEGEILAHIRQCDVMKSNRCCLNDEIINCWIPHLVQIQVPTVVHTDSFEHTGNDYKKYEMSTKASFNPAAAYLCVIMISFGRYVDFPVFRVSLHWHLLKPYHLDWWVLSHVNKILGSLFTRFNFCWWKYFTCIKSRRTAKLLNRQLMVSMEKIHQEKTSTEFPAK